MSFLKSKSTFLWVGVVLLVPVLYYLTFNKSFARTDCNKEARQLADTTGVSKAYKPIENIDYYKTKYDFFYKSCMRKRGYE